MTLPIVNVSYVTCLVVFVGVLKSKRKFSIANAIFGQLIYMIAYVLEITFFDVCHYVLLILHILYIYVKCKQYLLFM